LNQSHYFIYRPRTSTPPMGRTACTEPKCLYKGALYLYFKSSSADIFKMLY